MPRDPMITTSIRLPLHWIERATKLAEEIDKDPDAVGLVTGAEVVRSDVIRAALRIGLDALAERLERRAA